MTTVRVSFPEVMVYGNSVEYAGIRHRCHPNLDENSQMCVAITMYSKLT